MLIVSVFQGIPNSLQKLQISDPAVLGSPGASQVGSGDPRTFNEFIKLSQGKILEVNNYKYIVHYSPYQSAANVSTMDECIYIAE